ncbi:hypothetical protein KY331_02700 [Candidatus Woesearchaeota archaeon]|nr:hypothetical protein [Candidatus Woesearchaeota archaeon]
MTFRFISLFRRIFRKKLIESGETDIPTDKEIWEIIKDLDKLFKKEKGEEHLFRDEIYFIQSLHYDVEVYLHKRFPEKKETKTIFNKIEQLRDHSINKAHKFGKVRELISDIYSKARYCKKYDQFIEGLRKETDPESKKKYFRYLEIIISTMEKVRDEEEKLEEAISALQDSTKEMREIIKSITEAKEGSPIFLAMSILKSLRRPALYRKITGDLRDLDYNLSKQEKKIPGIRKNIEMLEEREEKVLELMRAG